MLKFLKENLKYTNDCIILATPMVLFIMFLQFYIDTFQYNLFSVSQYIKFFLTLWIALSGCFAGWFYMVKKTLQFSKRTYLFDTDRLTALSKLFQCMFKGVGKFFIHFLGLFSILFLFLLIKSMLVFYIFKTDIKPDLKVLNIVFNTIEFVLAYWFIYLIPEIVYTYNKTLKSIINSVKKSFISFRQTFRFYILIVAVFLFLYLAINVTKMFPIVYFLVLLLFYYFILYCVILIFRLYEKNFIE